VLCPSGLSAVSTGSRCRCSTGRGNSRHRQLLRADPHLCSRGLGSGSASTTTFYDPADRRGIAALITDRTRAIFVESPGSLTFEMQDLPAIVAAAQARATSRSSSTIPGRRRCLPNPLALGADMVVHAATKMFVGHSDAMVGTVSANERTWPRLKRKRIDSAGRCDLTGRFLPDAARHADPGAADEGAPQRAEPRLSRNGWSSSPAWAVYHPALPASDPGHAIWKRDFSGAGSLFAFGWNKRPGRRGGHGRRLRALRHGLFVGRLREPLHSIQPDQRIRTAVPWTAEGQMFRIHVGLEDIDDLKADMAAALERYRGTNE
jgi:cystathionine beta-lyase